MKNFEYAFSGASASWRLLRKAEFNQSILSFFSKRSSIFCLCSKLIKTSLKVTIIVFQIIWTF